MKQPQKPICCGKPSKPVLLNFKFHPDFTDRNGIFWKGSGDLLHFQCRVCGRTMIDFKTDKAESEKYQRQMDEIYAAAIADEAKRYAQ